MAYYIYNITDICQQILNIDDTKSANLDRLFVNILGATESGNPGDIEHFEVEDNEGNKVTQFRNLSNNKRWNVRGQETFFNELANDLLAAELIEFDGKIRRSRRITQGILIIKYVPGKLILLKLEETESIDTTTFEVKNAFAPDKKYYKVAIISDDSISIIDKNRKVAKYWVYAFLKLKRIRDDIENTRILYDLIIEDRLINENTVELSQRKTLKNTILEMMKSEISFEPETWFEQLVGKEDLNLGETEYKDFFITESLNMLDSGFTIDRKTINKLLRQIIEINSQIKLDVTNIQYAIDKGVIRHEGNYLQLTIDERNIQLIRELFLRNEGSN